MTRDGRSANGILERVYWLDGEQIVSAKRFRRRCHIAEHVRQRHAIVLAKLDAVIALLDRWPVGPVDIRHTF